MLIKIQRQKLIKRIKRGIALICITALLVPSLPANLYAAQDFDTATVQTYRVGDPNKWSDEPSISADGNLIAFESAADNLVANDTNGATDIFVFDQNSGKITRASIGPDGQQMTSASEWPDISADGQWVAFTAGGYLYIHSLNSNQTFKIASCFNKPSISGDGSKIVFSKNSNLYLAQKGPDQMWGTADDVSWLRAGEDPAISSNGRYVAFNQYPEIFVYDLETKTSTRVDVSTAGAPANSSSSHPEISADGRFISFDSFAKNLVSETIYGEDVFIHDRDADGNGIFDEAGGIKTSLVSMSSEGSPANGASGDIVNGWGSMISEDGRYVVFESDADNLVPGDTNDIEDIFVRDVVQGKTIRVSQTESGGQIQAAAATTNRYPVISGSGDYVAYVSESDQVVSGDSNETCDIFVARIIEGSGSVVISTDGGLTEDNLDGAIVNVLLKGETFIDDQFSTDNFDLVNAPPGLTVDKVDYVDAADAKLYLKYDGTDFDTDFSDFAIAIKGTELTQGSSLQSNGLLIEGFLESGQIVLGSSIYTANEGDGELVVTLERIGGSDGWTSAAVRLYDDTAIEGDNGDFVDNYNGRYISFYNGETSKDITIPIIDDALEEGTETFTIHLYSEVPSDVGELHDATVSILDNDSSGGVEVPLHINTVPLPDGEVGSVYGYSFTATGGTLPYTYTTTGSSIVVGLSLDSNGQLSGTPEESGTFSFTVEVTDALGDKDSHEFELKILDKQIGVNSPPQIQQLPDQRNMEGNSIGGINIAAQDNDEDDLSFTAEGLPKDVSINHATGVISGTLAEDSAGTYEVTVTVSDGKASSQMKFTWTIESSYSGGGGTSHPSAPGITLKSLHLSADTTKLTVGQAGTVLKVTASFSDGSEKDVTNSVSWQLSEQNVIALNGNKVNPLAAGTVMIKAVYQGLADSMTMRVQGERRLVLSPESVSAKAGKEPVQFTASLIEEDGSILDVTDAVSWQISDLAKGEFINSGLVMPKQGGTVAVTANFGEFTAQSVFNIIGIQSLQISPRSKDVMVGSSPEQFKAIVIYADNSTEDITEQAEWALSNPLIVRLNAPGKVEARQAGRSVITAYFAGLSAVGSIGVSELEITPPSATLFTPGSNNEAGQGNGLSIPNSTHFQAFLKNSDGTVTDVTRAANWSVSDSQFAAIDSAGTLTAQKKGVVTVTAAYGSFSRTAVVWILDQFVMPKIQVLAAWENPNQVRLRWAVEDGWLPPQGLDLYRVTTNSSGETNRVKVATVGSETDLKDNVLRYGDKTLPIWSLAERAVVTPERLQLLESTIKTKSTLDSLNVVNQNIIERTISGIDQTIDPDELKINLNSGSFRNYAPQIESIFKDLPMLPEDGKTFSRETSKFKTSLARRDNIGSPVDLEIDLETEEIVDQVIDIANEDDSLSQMVEDIRDTRSWIQTAANLDKQFADQMGFGYTDTLNYQSSDQGKIVTYRLVPAGINLEALENAGFTVPSVGLEMGIETLPAAPAHVDGYGMDGKVNLRWDVPEASDTTLISGYNIERKIGEGSFIKINDQPVVIGLTMDDNGELNEPAVFYTDSLENGQTAEYRVKAIDLFGRQSQPSDTLSITVKKTLSPEAPQLDQPVLDSDVNDAWEKANSSPSGSGFSNERVLSQDFVHNLTQTFISKLSIPPYGDSTTRYTAVPFVYKGTDQVSEYRVYRSQAVGTGQFNPPQLIYQFNEGDLGQKAIIWNNSLNIADGINNNEDQVKKFIFYDTDITPGTTYKYWISVMDRWQNESPWSSSGIVGCPMIAPPDAPTDVEADFIEQTFSHRENSELGILKGNNNPPGFFERFLKGSNDSQTNTSTNEADMKKGERQADTTDAVNQKYTEVPYESFSDTWKSIKVIPVAYNNLNPDGSYVLKWAHLPNVNASYRVFVGHGQPSLTKGSPMANMLWSSIPEWSTRDNQLRLTLPATSDILYFMITFNQEASVEQVPAEENSGADDALLGGYVTVSWTADDPQVQSYKVYRAEANQDVIEEELNWALVGDNITKDYYKEKVDQSKVHYYRYKVAAVDMWGNESAEAEGEQVRIPTTVPPDAPQLLVPREEMGLVNVRWAPVPDAQNYIIYRSEIPAVSMAELGQLAANINGEPFNAKKQTIAAFLLSDDTQVIKDSLFQLNTDQQLQMYHSILDRYGILALAPYGRLDKDSAKEVEWQEAATLSVSDLGTEGFSKDNGVYQWQDQTVEYPKRYLYTVAAVNEDHLISDRLEPVSASPRKDQPPAAPALSVQSTTNGPQLTWSSYVPDGEISESLKQKMGYIVLRSETEHGQYYQISDLLKVNSYTDTSAPLGIRYWYTVKTADEVGLVSQAAQPKQGQKLNEGSPDIEIITPNTGSILPDIEITIPEVTGGYDTSVAPFSATLAGYSIENIKLYQLDYNGKRRGTGTINLLGKTMIVNVVLDSSTLEPEQAGATNEVTFNLDQDETLINPSTVTLSEFTLNKGNSGARVNGRVNIPGVYSAGNSPNVEFKNGIMSSFNYWILADHMSDVRVGDYLIKDANGITLTLGNPTPQIGNLPYQRPRSPISMEKKLIIASGNMEMSVGSWLMRKNNEQAFTPAVKFHFDNSITLSSKGKLTGQFNSLQQQIALVVPQGLKINITQGRLKLEDGIVDAVNSSITGNIELPFTAAQSTEQTSGGDTFLLGPQMLDASFIEPDNTSDDQQVDSFDITYDKFDFKVLEPAGGITNSTELATNAAQLTDEDKHVLQASIAYAFQHSVGSGYECPQSESADHVQIPFNKSSWNGKGLTQTVQTTLSPICIGGGFQLASREVVIDLASEEAPSPLRPDPNWQGLIMEDVMLTLPKEFSQNDRLVRFDANQEFYYEQNGLSGYYDPGLDTTGAQGIQLESLLGFGAELKGVTLDVYAGEVTAEIMGQLTVDALGGKKVSYRVVSDSSAETFPISILADNNDDNDAIGESLSIVVEGGRLQADESGTQGELVLNGQLLVNDLDGLTGSEGAEFAELVIPSTSTSLAAAQSGTTSETTYGTAVFINNPWFKLHGYDFELKSMEIIPNSSDFDMRLNGEAVLAKNLPHQAGGDDDVIFISNVFTHPAVNMDKTEVSYTFPYAGMVNIDSKLKMEKNPENQRYEFTANLGGGIGGGFAMHFALGLATGENARGNVMTRIGRDDQGNDYWIFGLTGGMGKTEKEIKDYKKDHPEATPEELAEMAKKIQLGPLAFKDFVGVLSYNMELPDKLDFLSNNNLEDFIMKRPVKPGQVFLVANATELDIADVVSAGQTQILIHEGPNVKIIGKNIKIQGAPFGSTDILVEYRHPDTLSAVANFKDLTLPIFDVGKMNGSISFLSSSDKWAIGIGYPKIIKVKAKGDPTTYGFGVGYENSDNGWAAKAKVLIGYETKADIGIVYLEAFVTAQGEVIIKDQDGKMRVIGKLTVKGQGKGGIKWDDTKYEIITLAVTLQGEFESPDPLKLTGSAEIYYHLNLALITFEDKFNWQIQYIKP